MGTEREKERARGELNLVITEVLILPTENYSPHESLQSNNTELFNSPQALGSIFVFIHMEIVKHKDWYRELLLLLQRNSLIDT